MLRNASGFPGSHIGLPDDVEQGGLAMVDMPHDGHHGSARNQFFRLVFDVQFNLPDRCVDQTTAALTFFDLEPVAVVGANLLRNSLLYSLVNGCENPKLHQV